MEGAAEALDVAGIWEGAPILDWGKVLILLERVWGTWGTWAVGCVGLSALDFVGDCDLGLPHPSGQPRPPGAPVRPRLVCIGPLALAKAMIPSV